MADGGEGIREFVERLMHGFPDGTEEMWGDECGGVCCCKGVIVREKSVVVELRGVVAMLQRFGGMPLVKMGGEDACNVFPVCVNLKGSGVREGVEGESGRGPVQHAFGEAGDASCQSKV